RNRRRGISPPAAGRWKGGTRRKLRKSTPSGPADAGTGKYSRIRPTCLSDLYFSISEKRAACKSPQTMVSCGGKTSGTYGGGAAWTALRKVRASQSTVTANGSRG